MKKVKYTREKLLKLISLIKEKLNVKWYGYCQECNSRTEYPFYD